MSNISFKHSGNVGDIIYSFPAVRSLLRNKGIEKADFYIQLNVPMGYSGSHPLGNVLMNEKFFQMLKPLLKSQSFIDKVEIFENQKIDVDLDTFRKVPINPFTYCIPRWYFLFIVGTNWDLSLPWLEVEKDDTYKDYILVSRNNRYKSKFINYSFVNKEMAKKIVVVGVEKEFQEFKMECPYVDNFFQANNFLDLAKKIAGCKAFVGCAGFPYALAESIKVKRLLESNNVSANVVPSGGEHYDALFQKGFEYWFNNLRGRNESY